MQRTRPPFRADVVGSFLRPQALKDARTAKAAGKLTAEQLRAVEDREITRLVGKLEELGLRAVTDGEFRRSWWHWDFIRGLDGIVMSEQDESTRFQGVRRLARPHISGKVGFSRVPMVEDFRFLAGVAKAAAKMTIPSPSVLHRRLEPETVRAFYADADEFLADLAAAYGQAVAAFYDAGCRYLQFDDTTWAFLCSPDERDKARARGEDFDRLQHQYAKCVNDALAGRPADLAITMHSCRGNFRSTWASQGGYEPVAERLFNDVNIDGYFLEYDSERAGGFEPLRFFPKGNKMLVLGLITSKSSELEAKDEIRRRIDEASRYVDLDQLCLSPQCGFASTEEGNLLTEDEQWKKIELLVNIAEEVWGKA